LNLLFPSGYVAEIGNLRQQLERAHYAWWEEWKGQQPDFKIENIRFKHVDGWNRKAFSIQSAHDGVHWIWKATRVAWMALGVGI
jgi:hypothetical protein